MALTPGGTPYVESSDLVANYPAVSLALAEHIDDLPSAILQVVRATPDTTNRTTTSTTFVDVTGVSITITPQVSTSKIIIICNTLVENTGAFYTVSIISDSANNSLNGNGSFQGPTANMITLQTLIAYNLPGVTTPVTYKMRFRATGATASVPNTSIPSEMYAIEVSA